MSNLGHSKHRKSGTPPTADHFTGKKKKAGGKRKAGLSRKQRKGKRGSHKNKYDSEREAA